MKIYTYLMVMVGALLLSSCATTPTSFKFRLKDADHQTVNKGVINQVSKIAEYRVDPQKVEGTYTGAYDRKFPSRSIELAKELAIGDAITKAKCDFLVSPAYDIEVNKKTITAKVIGHPAHYLSFKTQTASDSVLLKTQKVSVVPTSNDVAPITPEDIQKNNKAKAKKALKALGITYLILGAIVAIALNQ